jgi:ADP-L-glycero-D-manno-heptose 6-epimerase
MYILITGHKGFIGQNAVKRFSKNHKISVYDYEEGNFPNLAGVDIVMHFGAISSTVETDVEKVLKQNYDFTVRLIKYCSFWKIKLQYSSSASVYGFNKEFKESSPVSPKSPYAWSKFLIERFSQDFFSEPTNIQGFRYFNVYGPHEDHKGDQASPFHKFTVQAKETGKIKVFENSDKYLRDFIHVDEVLDVHEKFLSVPESGIWNVGTGKPRSFLSVAKSIAEEYNAEVIEILMPENIKLNYQEYTCADLTKLNATLEKVND